MRVRERIVAKLEACRPYYERVIELRPRLVEDEPDWIVWSALERNLHLAIECAIDVGEMLIAWHGWERPEENREVFRVLRDHGLVDDALATRLMDAAGLRNILVHQYARLDRERLREVAERDVDDLDAFARAVATHLNAQPEPER